MYRYLVAHRSKVCNLAQLGNDWAGSRRGFVSEALEPGGCRSGCHGQQGRRTRVRILAAFFDRREPSHSDSHVLSDFDRREPSHYSDHVLSDFDRREPSHSDFHVLSGFHGVSSSHCVRQVEEWLQSASRNEILAAEQGPGPGVLENRPAVLVDIVHPGDSRSGAVEAVDSDAERSCSGTADPAENAAQSCSGTAEPAGTAVDRSYSGSAEPAEIADEGKGSDYAEPADTADCGSYFEAA